MKSNVITKYMSFCLPKELSDKFVKALKTGVIKPGELIQMTSEERRSFLAKIVGEEDAKPVNALLESKLLLKDQKRGMVSWAKKVAGISEEVRHDMISKIEKMDKILNAKDEQTFLEDLASQRLGTDVTFQEAQVIADLSKKVTESKAKVSGDIGSASRIEYGAHRVALQEYMKELKLEKADTAFSGIKDKLRTNPLGAMKDVVTEIGGMSKGILASFDNSFAGRQGFGAIFTYPKEWASNFAQSFGYIDKQLGKKASDNSVIDGIKADIYSRPNAIDGTYSKMKLDIGLDSEEAYPTSLPEKIPGLGRMYKASETAYNGMAIRLRADIADKLLEIARDQHVDLTDKLEIESIGRLVNSLTGRGNLGAAEKVAGHFNTVFFSPRSVKANFDFLTLHATDKMSVFARKQAATNLLKTSAGIATIMMTANALWPGSAELDPTSTDFGKIKIGNTRFDISGGKLGLVVLAARMITGHTKSSTTGKTSELNSGKFGGTTKMDLLMNFALNKTAPVPSAIVSYLRGHDFAGNKPTLKSTATNLVVPLPFSNIHSLMSDPNAANPLVAEIFDALGFVTNTYTPKKK